MSEIETATAAETQVATDKAEKTFTQDELNRIIDERLKREREKFAGFDEFKAKAAQLDEIQEASKSEMEKLMDRASKAESELEAMRTEKARRDLLDKVSKETGVPAELLKGDTEEELAASAQQIAEFVKANEPGVPEDKGGAATQKAPARRELPKII